MQLNEMQYAGDLQPVEGYGPGFFRIAGGRREGPLLTHASGPVPWRGLEDVAPLLALAGEIDVILFGMGAEIAHIPTGLRDQLEAAGMGCEIMSSASACTAQSSPSSTPPPKHPWRSRAQLHSMRRAALRRGDNVPVVSRRVDAAASVPPYRQRHGEAYATNTKAPPYAGD